MLTIKHARKPNGAIADIVVTSPYSQTLDANGLTVLPAMIDPHVHFRIPGAEHKEDWMTGARAAVQGGATTVIDMPNNIPSCTTLEALIHKHGLIQEQLKRADIPLRYYLYFGADKKNLGEIPKVKDRAIGIKVFMGSSTGDLLIDDDDTLAEIFRMAADLDMLVSVHAEDEEVIRRNKALLAGRCDPAVHSEIRSRDAAIAAVDKALGLSQRFRTRLCILHVSTKEEVDLIRAAKAASPLVAAEAAPHHLLLTTGDYTRWGTRVQVNPPLREDDDRRALWKALNDGTIDFVGTDHAPHTLEEKAQPYGKAPSGIASIDLMLPLLIDAMHNGLLTMNKLIDITSCRAEKVFGIPPSGDMVLVDLQSEAEVSDEALATKCGWSPYAGRRLKGWPVYTIAQGKVFTRSRHAHAY